MTETIDQIAETQVKETENLFSASSAAPIVIEDDYVAVPDRHLRDEFPFQDVTAQFAIPQKVHTASLASGFLGIGTPLTYFPDLLNTYFATTRISRALAGYDWVRGTVNVRILFRASATLYGSGYAWWYYGSPQFTTGYTSEYDKWLIPTSSHCDLIDLAQHNEIIWKIPYRYPESYFNKSTSNYFASAFLPLQIGTLEPTAPKNVDVEVWVSMEDVEVSGYIEAQADRMPVVHHSYAHPPVTQQLGLVAAAGAVSTAGTLALRAGSIVAGQAYADMRKRLFGEVVRSATSTYKTMTSSKPKTAEAQQTPVIQQPYGNTASLAPTVELQTLTEMSLAKLPPSFGGDEEFHSLADIVQNCTFLHAQTFTTAGTEYVHDFTVQSGWFKQIHDYFRFFRGRHRLVVSFFTSPLISARFSVVFYPINGTSDVTDAGTMFETFEVKGSTTKVIEIPWTQKRPVRKAFNGIFKLRCVAAPRPLTSGATAEVFVLVHSCMGENTQFFSIRQPYLDEVPFPPPAAQIEGQSSLRDIGRGTPDIAFAGHNPIMPIAYMDETRTIEEIMSRWCSRKVLDEATNASLFRNSLEPTNQAIVPEKAHDHNIYGDNVDAFAPCFTLWRGSRDYRASNLYSTIAPNIGIIAMNDGFVSAGNSLDAGNGVAFTNLQLAPIQVRIPFFSEFPVVLACSENLGELTDPFGTDTSFRLPVNTDPDPIVARKAAVYISRAGPDFQVFHLNRLYFGCAAFLRL